jgi:hypothetical protein
MQDDLLPNLDVELADLPSPDKLAIASVSTHPRSLLQPPADSPGAGAARADAIALVQALRPKAIQHPAHLNWINQFGAAH